MTLGPAGWAYGKGGAVLTNRMTISNAQVLACFTTPIQILPPPGAGKIIFIVGVSYRVGGTADYTDTNWGLFYGSPTNFANADSESTLTGGMLHGNVILSSGAANGANGGGITLADAKIINQPVTFGASDANPATGDGAIDLTAIYLVV